MLHGYPSSYKPKGKPSFNQVSTNGNFGNPMPINGCFGNFNSQAISTNLIDVINYSP